MKYTTPPEFFSGTWIYLSRENSKNKSGKFQQLCDLRKFQEILQKICFCFCINSQLSFEVLRKNGDGDAPSAHSKRRRKQGAWIRARSRPSKREIIYARNLSFYQLLSIFFFAITLKTLKIENNQINWAQFLRQIITHQLVRNWISTK